MKVYLVWCGEYEDTRLRGIYVNREDAITAIHNYNAKLAKRESWRSPIDPDDIQEMYVMDYAEEIEFP